MVHDIHWFERNNKKTKLSVYWFHKDKRARCNFCVALKYQSMNTPL